MVGRRGAVLGTAVAAALLSFDEAAPAADLEEPLASAPTQTFGLSVAVARGATGRPVANEAWIAAQIAEASALFALAGIAFRWALAKELPAEHAELRSPDDRDALAAFVETGGGVVDVFVASVLEDVDEPGRLRRGVCWTERKRDAPMVRPRARFIVVAASAPSGVLAHELGHFFGNAHTTMTDNLMSYARSGGPVAFDPKQLAAIRRHAASFVAVRRLVPLGPPRLLP